ncbi:3'-5' exonuclease [Streptomyces sp. HUCO-GS316]|uniref:3'-5' exonuclease n=1 Tax=Streptomyces sp. HUCO-GS316 TaxID=2692198 RepID=UPI001F26B851|nr:hypothetical protein [Streptomyces sp. HUCO-GS316]
MTNEVFAEEPAWEKIADEVGALLGTAWIAEHHSHIDYRVLAAYLPQWRPAGVIDTLRLAKANSPGLPKCTLDALIEHLAPNLCEAPAQRHRAAFEAYATAQLLVVMASRYETWDQLIASAVPPGLPGVPRTRNKSPPCGDACSPPHDTESRRT